MNKFIKILGASAILALTFFIPLSQAGEAPIQLASSFALHSYAGEPCKRCCDEYSVSRVKCGAVQHKHHRKQHTKCHHKYHHKAKPVCRCQYL